MATEHAEEVEDAREVEGTERWERTMLRSLRKTLGYALMAEDGTIGRCRDFLFDDADWVVRYMVADTGTWIPRRKVLIAPAFLDEPDWPAEKLPVSLIKGEIEGSPPLDVDLPVSRQHEEALAEYFRLPAWWSVASDDEEEGVAEAAVEAAAPEPEDPHLRSLQEVLDYTIDAEDGEVGHVEDLVVDDQEWTIRYLMVDTRDWLPGRKVLVAPRWLRELDWAGKRAVVELTREQIEESPEYESETPIYRAYEADLHEGYGKHGYWEE